MSGGACDVVFLRADGVACVVAELVAVVEGYRPRISSENCMSRHHLLIIIRVGRIEMVGKAIAVVV